MIPYFEQVPAMLRVEPFGAVRFPDHLHTHVEWLYLTGGSVCMRIDGERYVLGPGDLAMAFPGVVHGYENAPGDTACGLLVMFSPALVSDYYALLMRQRPSSPLVRASDELPDIAYAMNAMSSEEDEAVCKAFIQLVLARTISALSLRDAAEIPSHDILKRAIEYLSRNFALDVTLESVSRALGVSKYYLSHLFSDRLHISFRAYINALRMNRAQVMLRSSDMPITRICYDCGFDNQRTFNRVFKEHFGMTPREYRL